MEATTIAAIGAASDAVAGAAIGAATALIASRQSLRQRAREQLLERAYEAAIAEFRAHIDAHKFNVEQGRFDTPLPQIYFLTFHLALLNRLTDLREARKLDAKTIARALQDASIMADAWDSSEESSGVAK